MEPEPSTSAVAGALQLDATAFVNDLVNSVSGLFDPLKFWNGPCVGW